MGCSVGCEMICIPELIFSEYLSEEKRNIEKAKRAKRQNVAQAVQRTPKPDPLAELDNLVGLRSVKNEVRLMVNYLKVQKARDAAGLATSEQKVHMVFHGNPGTGKTTVARLLSEIYCELGMLTKGHLVETDRSGLVGEYIGQTALKVKSVINQALGGVLFIDEAYALKLDERDFYGSEAIATLLKLMEDHRDELIVIAAGYPREMQSFLDANPGLRSRFNKYLTFEDYTVEELIAIFKQISKERDYDLLPEAEVSLGTLFSSVLESNDRRLGNGRLVRNCLSTQSSINQTGSPHMGASMQFR